MKIIKKFNTFLESKNDLYDIIPQSIKDISILFKNNDKELYLVGGAVRDFLNNESPKDFDLCTNATPDEILNIVGNKYKTTEHGKSFGVIVIYTNDQPMGIEVATFREDIYDDKLGITRNPEIKFSTIEKDVLRRDITYNSMFYDLQKRKIIDLVGGVDDLKNEITRFVGNPDDRIGEDPLRILRVLRFSCRYNFNIDFDTKKSITQNKNQLSIISQERIWEEIMKAWKQAKDYTQYLSYFKEFDMWSQVFPGVKVSDPVNSADFSVVIASLLRDNPSDYLDKKLVQDFRIDTSLAKKIVFLVSLRDFDAEKVLDYWKRRQSSGISDQTILEWLTKTAVERQDVIKFVDWKPSVKSEELINKGFAGKALGEEIRRLEVDNFKGK